MRTLLLTFLSALVFPLLTHAQSNLIDVVYHKNGSIIKGIITEQVPGKAIKLQTADGSLFVFESEEILKMTREAGTVIQREINPSGYDSPSKPKDRDDWGRTYAQNVDLADSRQRSGVGFLFGGGILLLGGGSLLAIGAGQPLRGQSVFWVTGGTACALSIPLFGLGGSLLGKSKMYRDRAKNMKEENAYLTPTFIGTQRYSGAQLQGGTAMGVSLNIRF